LLKRILNFDNFIIQGDTLPITNIFALFFLAHLAFNISHFNLLLRNHWANCNQTLVEWSLGGPLPKLCLVIPTSNQDGRLAKNRKKGGWNLKKNLLLWNYWANLNQTLLKWSLGGPSPKLCLAFQTSDQDGHHSRT
jgi:hypothetical protein